MELIQALIGLLITAAILLVSFAAGSLAAYYTWRYLRRKQAPGDGQPGSFRNAARSAFGLAGQGAKACIESGRASASAESAGQPGPVRQPTFGGRNSDLLWTVAEANGRECTLLLDVPGGVVLRIEIQDHDPCAVSSNFLPGCTVADLLEFWGYRADRHKIAQSAQADEANSASEDGLLDGGYYPFPANLPPPEVPIKIRYIDSNDSVCITEGYLRYSNYRERIEPCFLRRDAGSILPGPEIEWDTVEGWKYV